MRHWQKRNNDYADGLANFSLTFAKALLVFCVILFMLISSKANDGVKPKAEYLITVDWVGHYDVDTHLRLPDGSRVNFENKESGIAFLERDDLGKACEVNSSTGPSDMCEEITVLRGIVPGEYVLALHLYSANGLQTAQSVSPVVTHVKLEKLNPSVVILWQTTAQLSTVREERRLIRFTVAGDGSVPGFDADELPSIVYDR
jgi:hypothetical protein